MRGHKRQRGTNVWRFSADGPRDPATGKRRTETRTFHGTERQAETALARFVTDVSMGTLSGSADVTVEALVLRWFEHVKPKITPNTERAYQSKIDHIIVPMIGNLKLRELTTERLDEFYEDLLAGRGRKPLAPQSVRHVHAVIRAALAQALRWDWVKRNAAVSASPPSVPRYQAPMPDMDAVSGLLKSAPTETLGDIAYLAAFTGMRVGELCALQWGDLDVKDRSLIVQRRIMINGDIADRTKNNRSRILGLDRRTVARLRLRRVRSLRRARIAGVEITKTSFIFSEEPDGVIPLPPGVVSQRWSKHRAAAESTLRFHDLRHFHISVLLDAGVQLGRVSQRAGHSRPSVTSDIYAHVMRPADHDLAQVMGDMFDPKKTKPR